MPEFHSFDDKAVSEALEAAREPYQGQDLMALGADSAIRQSSGELHVLAQCIGVSVQERRVCLNLPLGFGSACLPIPINIPDGTAAQACLGICTTWGFPTGLRVSVIVAGISIVSQTFGKC